MFPVASSVKSHPLIHVTICRTRRRDSIVGIARYQTPSPPNSPWNTDEIFLSPLSLACKRNVWESLPVVHGEKLEKASIRCGNALLFGWIQARDPLIGGEAFPSSSPRCPVTIIHFDRSKRADLLLLLWARLSEERSTEINCAIKKWKGRGRGGGRGSTRGEGGVRVCAKLGADVIQGGGEKWVARRVEWLFRLVPSRSYSEKSDEDRKYRLLY